MIDLDNPLYVAGHRHYQDRFAELGEGEFLGRLVREPSNSHDSNAIMVMTLDNTKLGYVPKWKAKVWAEAMDMAGQPETSVRISILPPDPDKGQYRAEMKAP